MSLITLNDCAESEQNRRNKTEVSFGLTKLFAKMEAMCFCKNSEKMHHFLYFG